ncbi:MAG: hypothetical protein ACHQ1D_01135 [Nitrososphaerales archaeon]
MALYTSRRIAPLNLIRFWKAFKTSPNRVFIKADFANKFGVTNANSKIVLEILLKMKLIERVECVYRVNTAYADRTTNGYKLK